MIFEFPLLQQLPMPFKMDCCFTKHFLKIKQYTFHHKDLHFLSLIRRIPFFGDRLNETNCLTFKSYQKADPPFTWLGKVVNSTLNKIWTIIAWTGSSWWTEILRQTAQLRLSKLALNKIWTFYINIMVHV